MRIKKAQIRKIEPDTKYNSILVAKLINRSMRNGKKSIAANQVYKALKMVEEKTNKKPVEALEEAIEIITPQMEVRSRRVGGASYQIPVPVKFRRGMSLAVRWLVTESNKKPNKQFHSYAEKLAAEIMDAIRNQGGSIEKKIGAHKMAEANKAFSHFRW